MCPCGVPRPCDDSQIKKKTNEQHKRNVKIIALQIIFSNQEGWVKFTWKILHQGFLSIQLDSLLQILATRLVIKASNCSQREELTQVDYTQYLPCKR